MEKAAEQTLDRSFDQTAEHVHRNGEPCPTCKSFECIGATPAAGKDAAAGPPYCEHCGVSMAKVPFPFDNFCSNVCRTAAGPDDFGGEDFPTDRQPRAIGNTFPEHLRLPFDRHVSPAILKQRILDWEDEKRKAAIESKILRDDYKNALRTVNHLERLTNVLSSHIDKLTVVNQQLRAIANHKHEPEGGQPLPFAFPAEETDETRKRA